MCGRNAYWLWPWNYADSADLRQEKKKKEGQSKSDSLCFFSNKLERNNRVSGLPVQADGTEFNPFMSSRMPVCVERGPAVEFKQ